MTDKTLIETFGETDRPYQNDKPKRRVRNLVILGLGVLIVLGMGSCVLALSSLYSMASERQEATHAFIEDVQTSGLPQADSSIWYKELGVTQEAIEDLQNMLNFFGPATEIAETNCSAESVASSTRPSGTFVMCVTSLSFETTTGQFEMTWKKESEDWKISRFYAGYVGINDYFEAKARADLEAEAAASESD